jgi:hypothetical protein
MIINYAATLRPFGTTTDIINDISTVLLGTSGAFTPLHAWASGITNPFASLGGDPECTGGSAFHKHFGLGQCNQIFHFWTFLTSFANVDRLNPPPTNIQLTVGRHFGVTADIEHECNDLGGAGSDEDARLSSAALEIVTDRFVTPANLADNVVNILSSARPYGIEGALAWWYYHHVLCQPRAESEWQDRHTGSDVPAEFQSLPLPPELQCWGVCP